MTLLDDKQWLKAVRETPQVLPRSLWAHLNGIAGYLFLIGATDEALEVWRFSYSGQMPVPEQDTAFGDCCVSALCVALDIQDISRGLPCSNIVTEDDSLSQRVALLDFEMRADLTMDVWSPEVRLEPIEIARRGRALACPTAESSFSLSEVEALPHLAAYIAHPQAQHHAILQSLLLCADIAHRNAMPDVALGQLHEWKRRATWANVFLEEVLGLKSLASMCASGALSEFSTLKITARKAAVDEMLSALSTRLLDPRAPESAPTSISTAIFYGSFSLEPNAEVDPDAWHFPEEGAWTFDGPYPLHSSALTPGETGSARFEIELAHEPPAWKDAAFVSALPLRVIANEREGEREARVGNVFVSTPAGDKEDVGFSVAPGEYDVLARFYPEKSEDEEDEEVGLRHWKVVLTLLPRGVLRELGVLKAEE